MDEKIRPDFEMFFGIPYKAFCGKCGRIIFTGGRYNTIDVVKKKLTECPHCGCSIEWEPET